jgi:putative tricarboxylic transport membrane protein
MRVLFTLLILCLSVLYAHTAFTDLAFLSTTGRLGPGFFPRVIAVALIAACLVDLGSQLFRRSEALDPSDHWGTLAFVVAATMLFVLAMAFIGGYAAMFAFIIATLAVLNRGRWLQNVVIALSLPTAIYLMFEVWLGAAIPRGILLQEWLV